MTSGIQFNSNDRCVFLSYCNKDYDYVKKIKAHHSSRMINIKTAPHDILKGIDGFEEIQKTIQQSDVFAVLYTENTQKSEYIDQEIGIAKAYKIPILPISLCDCANPTGFIKSISAVKCNKELTSDEINKITNAIMTIVFEFNQSDIIDRLGYKLEWSSVHLLLHLLSRDMYDDKPLSRDDVNQLTCIYFMRKNEFPQEINNIFEGIIKYNIDRLNPDFKKIFDNKI